MEEQACALEGVVKEFDLKPRGYSIDISLFLQKSLKRIKSSLKKLLGRHKTLKYQLNLHVKLRKYTYTDSETETFLEPFFNSKCTTILSTRALKALLWESINEIIASFEAFMREGSGWTIVKILLLKLKVYKYTPFKGGCKSHKLPRFIRIKRACLSVNSPKNECFLYSVLASLYPSKYSNNANIYSQYKKHKKKLNLDNVHFPITENQLPQFERDNPLIGINVITYENRFYPVYASKNRETAVHKISLLLYQDHFYLIKNLSALLYASLSGVRNHLHFCFYCLCSYKTKDKLNEHELLCRKNLQCQTLPRDKTIKFKNFHHCMKIPFCIYWDLEATLEKNSEQNDDKILHTHCPISICAFRVCINSDYTSTPVIFTGTNCVDRFLEYVEAQSWEIQTILHNVQHKIRWTSKDESHFQKTNRCELCGKHFCENTKKCRDHCHISYTNLNKSSNARSVLCNRCNLTYGKQSHKLVVLSHNFRGYDQHHIITKLKNISNVHIIPKNTEQFNAIFLKDLNVTFIDSYAFLNSSLSNLADTLISDKSEKMKNYLMKYITQKPKCLKLLQQKGVFPYEALNNESDLKQTCLPTKEAFYDTLCQRHISLKQYRHAKHTWKAFHCETMKDYLELYVKLDVLLLAAIFEEYRDTYYKCHNLDVMHYISGPSLAFDSMLKMCKVELDVLPSIDMYNFFQSSIRGGIAGTVLRYFKANNKYCNEYNKENPKSFIVAYDINALYSWALSNPLPMDNFKWMNKEELQSFDVTSISEDGPIGYTLEVSLSYPQHLHQLHKDLPLCPEKNKISPDDWSPYTLAVAKKFHMKLKSGAEKLILSFTDKHRYILHYTTLQLYLRLGLKLESLHRGVVYNQKPWMKKFINHNINLRIKAKTTFESNLHKLSNNSVFGVTMTNIFRQVNYQLIDSPVKFKKLAGKPSFHACKIINKNLVGVQLKKETVVCSKPIYAGTSCLDISKNLFYRIYYDFLLQMYGKSRCQLIYTDTDSYYVALNTEDVYKDMLLNEHCFDLSNFNRDSNMFSNKRKRVPGLLKDVYPECCIEEVCALRSKLYAVKLQDGSQDVKAKGVKKSVIETLNLKDFKESLCNVEEKRHKIYNITRKKHVLSTRSQIKTTISPFEDKRYWLMDGISSLPHGHYLLRKRKISDNSSHNTSPLKRQKCCV
jgi:hypothetical protein